MVFFMVFLRVARQKTSVPWVENWCWHGIRELELRVIWSNQETCYTSTASNYFAISVPADSPENKMV